MISVSVLWRWAAASNERAVANARAAATQCSRRRVERAEVEQFLVKHHRSTVGVSAEVAATGR